MEEVAKDSRERMIIIKRAKWFKHLLQFVIDLEEQSEEELTDEVVELQSETTKDYYNGEFDPGSG